MALINIAGFDVYLSRKRIKNINLRIDRQGNIKVSAPLKCPQDYIQGFLQKKQDWITTHQTRLRHSPLLDIFTLQSGEQHFFLGQPYSLMVYEHSGRNRVAIEDNHLCFYIQSVATEKVKLALLINWQRQEMQTLLPVLIQKWETIIGVEVKEWTIRLMKTRWGTCNPIKKRICLNLYLIQQPLVYLEYVVVHELVHLLEASHNRRFYALMSQFMPEWKEYRRLLNNNKMQTLT